MKPTAYLTTFLGLPGASGEKRAACNFDLTSRYFYNVSSEESFFQTIDAETTADLDLNAVFERIDRTASKPGQQYLYARLRTARRIISPGMPGMPNNAPNTFRGSRTTTPTTCKT